LGFATAGPVAFVSSVGNLVPFIFPSNWFQFKEAKELNAAEKLSYASLRGNVVNGVEGLLYIHVRNTALLNMLSNEEIILHFSDFIETMKKHFLLNYDKLITIVEKEIEEQQKNNIDTNIVIITVYQMNANINYKRLKTELIKFYNNIKL